MAGKKKKGKGKGKGKKGKKGGKSKEPQMTAQEAILAYQINVVEKKLEDVSYEIRGWEEKNRRNVDRNEKLLEEQELLLTHLLKTSREVAKVLESEEVKTRDDVTDVMKDKWKRQREREKELEELKSRIAMKEVEIEKVTKDVSWWKSFRDSGQHKQQMQIKLLEQEIRDMESSFVDMAAHLTRDKDQAIGEIERYTEDTLSQQKDKASEKAMAQLDKKDRQEVLDNDWLKREVAIHRVETDKCRGFVEELEKENLELMSELFECSVEDLKISRKFYLTQFDDSENLDRTGILEMDLSKINVPSEETLANKTARTDSVRPKSATQQAVEDKVFSLMSYRTSLDDTQEESEGEESVHDSQSDYYENYFFEEEDFDDYLKLGPLELKLLNVTGSQVPIHEAPMPSQEEIEAKKWNPEEWPVTSDMLKGCLSNR
ncbi:coiled-coil domain-containing protein 83 [Aplysia californica]|uniref:Coiled-coil domain-containing protein 83 n=1 Tax=Aplysia californica TaxID=6500 RepID=A0ABM0JBS9_APLCA|nr:coiled-coil domain-containing protein 83 [Aplysia californica]XP_005090039.1 coiled-coil domain-containing protein 83 [Aplysia californica]